MVLSILSRSKKPLTPQQIQKSLQKNAGGSIGIVTIYRIIEAFEQAAIVHRHPLEGSFSLCTIPDHPGHHVLLHCTSCGTVKEAHDEALCRQEEHVAKSVGFRPSRHVSELSGVCASCS